MRSWVFISLLSGIGAVLQCDLSNKKTDLPFPDIESKGVESYQMSVEYTAYGATQTDFYTEYYDILYRRGRVDSHQAGISSTYVYRTASWEAWEITKDDCTLQNITETPNLYKDDQTDWTYMPADEPDRRTVGPSAMFKIALDAWNNDVNKTTDQRIMAYMGTSEKIRGLNAHRWRRCDGDGSYVDYYFSADDDVDAFGLPNLKRVPLQVLFGGVRKEKEAGMSEQQYEILTFQPYISLDMKPFQLPVGRGCRRGIVPDAPEIPKFKGRNIQLHAEVVYRTVNKDGDGTQYWSYYSTLFLAIDLTSNHLAYYYTPWSKTKTTEDPKADAPVHTIFDSKHGYMYKTSLDTGKCEISRVKNFFPEYKLPNDAGAISLLDPSILYPEKEFTYISEGSTRGLRVNVFEEVVKDYELKRNGTYKKIPKAVITHSYLQDDVVERDTVSVKNSLAQVQLRFTGRDSTMEVLTFNFFGFTTELKNRRSLFNIKRCFKDNDDYVWATIGFNTDKEKIQKVLNDVPSIKSSIVDAITLRNEMNPVRIPIIEVDVKDGIYVSLMILGKPPIELDYLEAREGYNVMGTKVEGVSDLKTCGTRCLEKETNCWGFGMCGAVCYFGISEYVQIGTQDGCQLYTRYDPKDYIPSKESLIKDLRALVEQEKGLNLMLQDKDDNTIQIDASSIEVTYPGENDRTFSRLGNILSPRMRVVKTGYKLKATAGTPITNMGRLRYDECQRLCLDFKDCETTSYCLKDSECVITSKYGDDLKAEDMVEDNMCNLITRKYADRFDRSPGIVMSTTAQEVLQLDTVEKCARACLTQTKYKCLSFDHCPTDKTCSLHTVHYPNANTREKESKRSANCGHYFRRFSTEFKKNPEKRMVGSKLPPLNKLTLEECSKSCMEYGKGTCFGFDFCQGDTVLSTSCTILDSDPSQMKSTYSPICTNYLRTEAQFAPRPYSNSYAGGIGFLCFLIGVLLGASIIFGITYMRANRR